MGLDGMTLTTFEEMQGTVYDVLVIGAGVGGSACLHRLRQHLKNEKRKIGILDLQNDLVGFPVTFCERPHSFETKRWDIPYSELEPYFSVAEKYLHKSFITAKESSLQKKLLDRLHINGVLEAVPAKLAQPQKASNSHNKPSNLTIHLALGGQALYLDVGAVAVKVHVVQGEKPYELQGKTLVLATGPLESPCILHRSGCKSPALGCYLSGTPAIQATGFLDSEGFSEEDDCFVIVKPVTKWEMMEMQITNHPLAQRIHFNGQGEVLPQEENRVVLGATENQLFKYCYQEEDYKGIHHILESMVSYAYLMGITLQDASVKLVGPSAERYKGCTCRMGINPETSVTDLHGRVHTMPNVFVADASVLPTLPASGPIVLTIALAMRLADYLCDHYSNP